MTVDDVTRWLGIVGGITGPLGLVITYLSYRRDAGRLRVRLIRNQRMHSPDDDAVRTLLKQYQSAGTHPPMELFIRDPDKTWLSSR